MATNYLEHQAYDIALREYRALGYQGDLNAEQYAFLSNLIIRRLRALHPNEPIHALSSAASYGIGRMTLDLVAPVAEPPPSAAELAIEQGRDRATHAFHRLGRQLAIGLPSALAHSRRTRHALRRVLG